jgi:hypothetical protein
MPLLKKEFPFGSKTLGMENRFGNWGFMRQGKNSLWQ